MEIKISEKNGLKYAEITAEGVILSNLDNALDLIADCGYNGADAMIVNSKNIAPEFFDLSTRIAGEILQKYTQYNMRLAITGDFSGVASKSLRDFIRESNKQGRILFVSSAEEALDMFK